MVRPMIKNSAALLAAAVLIATIGGCIGKPNEANIALRKENQKLASELEEAKSQRDANAATVRALQGEAKSPPMVSQEQLSRLVTTHQIRVGQLTSIKPASEAAFPNATKPAPAASLSAKILEVHAAPQDDTSDSIKAAGAFSIDAFDLARPGENRVGHWEFSASETHALWLTGAFTYEYALPCVIERLPERGKLTIRVSFTDSLTGRTFDAEKQLDVNNSNRE